MSRDRLPVLALSVCLALSFQSFAHAGDVKVTQHGVTLTLKGDDHDASLTLTSLMNGGGSPQTDFVSVLPVPGTTVNGSADAVSFDGVTQINVKLGNGENSLTLDQIRIEKGATINGGKGTADVIVSDSVFGKNVFVSAGPGLLDFTCDSSSFSGNLSVKGGRESDFVRVSQSGIDGDLHVSLGDGDLQTVEVELSDVFNLSIKTGRERDMVVLDRSTVIAGYKGDFGSGDNAFDITSSTVAKKVSYVSKGGSDFMSMESDEIQGDVTAKLGNGTNHVLLDDTVLHEDFAISAGSGDDQIEFDNTVAIDGKVKFKLDGGLNEVPAF